ncbi:hypothetical protein LIER_01158 [Lithospermum erythrorhizon]|uniref:Retrotransposon gag protein n=1 Tax=Lithospermum erythrorhizon TaxID=34254 RepID=A0AAV3NJW3_LITER
MTSTTTIEEQIASLKKMVEDMAKHMQRQEEALSNMARKIQDHEHRGQVVEVSMRTLLPQESPGPSKDAPGMPQTPPEQSSNMSKGQSGKTMKISCVSADETILASKLREFILGAIKDTQDEATPSHSYVKPYTSIIDSLKNPKQHLVHFVETCKNARTRGDHMVKQFIHFLKGNVFLWYTELELDSIDSWHGWKVNS